MDAPISNKRAAAARERAPPTAWASATRLAGVGLLVVCAWAVLRLHASVTTMPRHPPSLAEMLLSFVTVLTGLGGAMASFIGPDLFRSQPRPPRAGPAGIDHS
ncbi:MAG TPA: hypothetical protein VH331_06070 [Allosphingosinicella sp.]|jgi:hypothetical protein|nr:hypothetical protein [Allosphingosinicella sp.]